MKSCPTPASNHVSRSTAPQDVVSRSAKHRARATSRLRLIVPLSQGNARVLQHVLGDLDLIVTGKRAYVDLGDGRAVEGHRVAVERDDQVRSARLNREHVVFRRALQQQSVPQQCVSRRQDAAAFQRLNQQPTRGQTPLNTFFISLPRSETYHVILQRQEWGLIRDGRVR